MHVMQPLMHAKLTITSDPKTSATQVGINNYEPIKIE